MTMSMMPPPSGAPMAPPPPVAFTPAFYSTYGRNLRFTTMHPTLEVVNGWVRLSGPRVPPDRWKGANVLMKTVGPLAFLFIFLGLVMAVVTNSTAVGYAGLLIGAAVIIGISIWWKVWSNNASRPDVAQFPASNVGPISYGYNWNGAIWGIIFGLIGIVVVAMVMGRKLLVFTAQVDPGDKPKKVVLKFRNHAEAALAAQAIQAAATPMAPPYPYAA